MQKDNDRSTVVIMTHNRSEELRQTLAHMTSIPDGAPIIVVDNGSTDGTAEMVQREFPTTTLLSYQENLGAVARNRAVDRVETPYVAFCDDDTRWQTGSIDRAADMLDEHPSLAAVMAHLYVEPQLDEDPLTPELRGSPIPAPSWLPGPALLSVMAGTTMFRVEAFRQVGGFSPALWLGGEEELLSLDLVTSGWWLCWREDVAVHHAPSPARDSRRRRQLGLRNTLWTTWLRRPALSAVRRSATVLASAPKDRHTVSAISEAVGRLPWVLRERSVVPPKIERFLRLLEESQRTSVARRYVD